MKLNDITRGTGLEEHGITNTNLIYWTPPTPVLYEQIILRNEGLVSHMGPVSVKTGHYTGRAANDKFIVDGDGNHDNIWWNHNNHPLEPEKFDKLYKRLTAYLHGKDVFVQDCFVGANSRYRVPIRVITEKAWHSLFARNMFIQASSDELLGHIPKFTLIDMPNFHAIPSIDGTHSEAFVIINLSKKLVLIGGTSYAGEIKKSIFTVENYLLPLEHKVLPMHCSANIGEKGDVALFFGLSGTGKTTLSADPERALIGDDEHGWGDDGVFNFEGGCYAKVIKLSKEAEPEIYECTRKFGTILENVSIDTISRRIDFGDESFTENTRASYPVTHIPNMVHSGTGGHPDNIIMLTFDALGVLPPISRLTPEQAVYHFLSGYTAKVGGTESNMGKDPVAAFSPCYGAPFMPLHPSVYAKMLQENIKKHNVTCWLINTGWSGGSYGVGNRINLTYSRAMVRAALDGNLSSVQYRNDNIFGLHIPMSCEGIPSEMLDPRNTWQDKAIYDAIADKLANEFRKNIEQFRGFVPDDVLKVL